MDRRYVGIDLHRRRSVIYAMDAADLTDEFHVAYRPGRWQASLGGVVGGRGELQRRADRLDPETITVRVDERNYLLCWRSSSAPKKAAADLRISFARRSSAFSFSSSRIRALSPLVTPGSSPLSMLA